MAALKCQLGMSSGLREFLHGTSARERAAPVRAGLVAAGLDWARTRLRLHFTRQAFTLYPGAYLPRSRGWEKYKARKKGHRDPMVFCGVFRDSVLGRLPSFRNRDSGTSIQVRMDIPHGRAANLWTGRQRGGHNFAASLTAINVAEQQRMMEIIEETVRAELAARVGVLRSGIKVRFRRGLPVE